LPRRIRQANLAPQLRDAPARAAADAPAEAFADRDADEVRARMSALQRGWTAGRRQNAEQQPEAGSGGSATTGPGHRNENENEGDGR
ncbi:hypothetical protein, partial [Streptomyces antimicrobicus]